MDKNRINRLTKRLARVTQEDNHSPEWNRAMDALDECEDAIHFHIQEMERLLKEDVNPDQMKQLPWSKFEEVDSNLVHLQYIVKILMQALNKTEEVVKKHVGKENTINPLRPRRVMARYHQWLGQQMARYRGIGMNGKA